MAERAKNKRGSTALSPERRAARLIAHKCPNTKCGKIALSVTPSDGMGGERHECDACGYLQYWKPYPLPLPKYMKLEEDILAAAGVIVTGGPYAHA